MKTRIAISLFLFVFCGISSKAQSSNYLIGAATISIEPQDFPFSLALAGYGLPREGRFSLEWVNIGHCPNITTLATIEANLYAISNDNLISKAVGKSQAKWVNIGKAANLKLLTAYQNKLYSIGKNGDLLKSDLSSNLNWKRIGNAANANAVTAANNKLYMVDIEGVLWSSSPLTHENISWVKEGLDKRIISLTSKGNRLYGLAENNSLWQYTIGDKNKTWLKVAYQNGTTYNSEIKEIVVVGNHLYGLDTDYKLYRAKHSSDNSLSASAMAIEANKRTAIIVTADLIGFDESFTASIKASINEKYNIPPSAILINASHTHFSPVTKDFLTFGAHTQLPDSSYMYEVVKPGIIKAIEKALNNMEDADLYFGRGKTAIGANRSLSEDPIPYDNTVDVIKTKYKSNKDNNLVFLTGCHPVFENQGKEGVTISANYPGIARRVIKETGIANALFIQGCGGDINPVSNNHKETGEMLADDVTKVLNSSMVKINGGITYAMDTIQVPVTPWSMEKIEQFKKDNTNKEGDVYAEKNVRWADMMLKHYKERTPPQTLPVYVQTINIGDWKLIGLSREAVTDYSIGIKQIWPGKLVSVAGYSNDVSSYLPTSRHINAGNYEGYDSFFWYGETAVFPVSVYEIVIKEIKALNR